MNCNVLIGRSCWVIGSLLGNCPWAVQVILPGLKPNVGCSMTAALSCESDWSTRLSVKKIALCSVAVALSLHTSKLGFCLLGRRSGIFLFILFFIFYFWVFSSSFFSRRRGKNWVEWGLYHCPTAVLKIRLAHEMDFSKSDWCFQGAGPFFNLKKNIFPDVTWHWTPSQPQRSCEGETLHSNHK